MSINHSTVDTKMAKVKNFKDWIMDSELTAIEYNNIDENIILEEKIDKEKKEAAAKNLRQIDDSKEQEIFNSYDSFIESINLQINLM